MEIDEKAKRQHDDKPKGLPFRGVGPRAAFGMILLAALIMGLIIVVVIETMPWSPAPYPAARLIYNDNQQRIALDLRTGTRTILGKAVDVRDVLSPNGKWWARWQVDGELGDSWLELKNVTTGEKQFPLQQRFYGTGVRVNWSPDSQWIVFHADRALSSPETDLELWRVNVETSVLEQITHNDALDVDPDFSPDGTQLVYTSDSEGSIHLVIMTLATGETRRSPGGISGYGARWSPDGLWIAFSTVRYGMGPLWIVRADGSGGQMINESTNIPGFEWER